MAIILRLDRMMADRKMSLNTLAAKVGITNVNLSNIKTGKVSAIRFSTLNSICVALNCQPGDILEYQESLEENEQGVEILSITPTQAEKLLQGKEPFTQLGFSMLVSRLRHLYRTASPDIIEQAENEINAFLQKYEMIMNEDFATIEALY